MKSTTSTGILRSIASSIFAIAIALAFASATVAADFDHDGKADFAVFRPSTTTWISESSKSEDSTAAFQWGHASDVLVPADYDGDGQTDFAVWRPENGVWYVHQSGDKSVLLVRWGTPNLNAGASLTDIPFAADFDGDGMADLGIWHPTTGEWSILASSNDYDQNNAITFRWGKLGDVPVQADYDGDRKADFAVFRPTESRWYIRESSTGRTYVQPFGIAGSDTLVPADYTGDKKADIAVYRDGVWYVLNSKSGRTEEFHLGFSDDVAVPADYDGDGMTDFAVYRSGTFYVYDSSRPRLHSYSIGQVNDVPVNSGVVRASLAAIP